MTMIIAASLLSIVIIIILILAKKRKAKKEAFRDNTASAASPGDVTSPDQEYEKILDSLLKLNILMRKDTDLPMEMAVKIETIIDDLAIVIPLMMERYPGETLTWEIKKIGREHLFKTVKEFLDLSLESRKNQFDIFQKTVESLHEVSNRSRNIVEKNETAEFKTMANFLAQKF